MLWMVMKCSLPIKVIIKKAWNYLKRHLKFMMMNTHEEQWKMLNITATSNGTAGIGKTLKPSACIA